MPSHRCHAALTAVLALIACLASSGRPVAAAELSDEAILAGADARIEQYRKADAVVSVVDAQGKPVRGARVTVRQTRHAFLFGCNFFRELREPGDPANEPYRRRFAELLNYATLPFYWSSYEQVRGRPMHQRTEQVARWCRDHGIAVKGHPLAWNSSDPAWLPNDLDEIHRLQLARIDDCVGRFQGLIDRWDVINEVTAYDREQFVKSRAPKHSAMWQKVGQIQLARECFEHARQANPGATLMINDYRTDPAYERVIEQLVDGRGKPLYDVIGIQSHMHSGAWPTGKFWDVCQQFSRFKAPLHFTEMTIISGDRKHDRKRGGPWPTTPEGEAYQAREVARVYTILFSHPAVEAITWWDFSDKNAWQGAPAGLVRDDMTPKPAYDALKKLIKGKWWTETTLTTGADGQASFRGFLGDYRIEVSGVQGAKTEKAFRLKKGENRWAVEVGGP